MSPVQENLRRLNRPREVLTACAPCVSLHVCRSVFFSVGISRHGPCCFPPAVRQRTLTGLRGHRTKLVFKFDAAYKSNKLHDNSKHCFCTNTFQEVNQCSPTVSGPCEHSIRRPAASWLT